jgi:hypothetical protein
MFDKMFDSTILCAIIAGIWICLSVIEFIGLGTHIDSTDPQSVAKQGIMFTFEPSFPKIHKRVVILFCVLQIVYFLMYFISGGWINNDSKISFTDTNEWGKAKLSLSILGIIFLSYTFFLAIVDKNTWVQKITLTAVLPPKIEPSNGKK